MNALNSLVAFVIRVIKAVAGRKVVLALFGLLLTAVIAFGYIAIDGLMLDQLTVSIGTGMASVDATVADLVRRILRDA